MTEPVQDPKTCRLIPGQEVVADGVTAVDTTEVGVTLAFRPDLAFAEAI